MILNRERRLCARSCWSRAAIVLTAGSATAQTPMAKPAMSKAPMATTTTTTTTKMARSAQGHHHPHGPCLPRPNGPRLPWPARPAPTPRASTVRIARSSCAPARRASRPRPELKAARQAALHRKPSTLAPQNVRRLTAKSPIAPHGWRRKRKRSPSALSAKYVQALANVSSAA